MSGLLLLTGSTAQGTAKAEAHSAAAAADEDRGKVFSPESQAARRMLFGERDHLRDASHYEVLGVQQGASADEIKRAYFDAAKRFHSDSFSGLDLGSARRAAEEMFAKVNEAYSVLSDKNRRADHDVYLDRKAKGLPTDVGVILKAEALFQKGEALLKAGRWEEAEAQFRESIALNDTEAEFHAYLGMAMFRRSGRPEDGIQQAQKALEMDGRLHSATLFLAQMYEAQGDVERARTQLRKAIEKDPDFAQAKDELRRLRNPPAGQAKGGFLSRLLKK
jgi:curved DNA-binding protein CbpA